MFNPRSGGHARHRIRSMAWSKPSRMRIDRARDRGLRASIG